MRTPIRSLFIAGTSALLTGLLITGCGAKKKTAPAVTGVPAETSKPIMEKEIGAVLTARIQAISRKNRILTLKFPDGKVAKVKCGPSVASFEQIGVGDTITARFHELVEVYIAGPGGQPVWDEVKEIKKSPKGVKPGAAVIRAYEYSGTVDSIDYATRKVVLKGPGGKLIRVTGSPEVRRFNEIKPGDTVVARFVEALDIKIAPPGDASTAMRPSRRR